MKAKSLLSLLILLTVFIWGTSVQAGSSQEATFSAGCFWGVESYFSEIPGVVTTEVGYTGGNTVKPSYEQVCTGKTGHAESVHLTFNPQKISYKQLVERFLKMHNPGLINRQGPDIGTQYRSALFFYSPEQEKIAKQVISEQEKITKSKIYTQVSPAVPFYKAEEYHQKYNKKNKGAFCGSWFKK